MNSSTQLGPGFQRGDVFHQMPTGQEEQERRNHIDKTEREDRVANGLFAKPRREHVVAPDDAQPDASKWRVQTPRAGTKEPLRIDFDEPLDHAMLLRVLEVADGQERFVAGKIEVGKNEQSWSFSPELAWTAGPHNVFVDTTLEDLAGNSIGRPFEVDMFKKVTTVIQRARISIPFEVR